MAPGGNTIPARLKGQPKQLQYARVVSGYIRVVSGGMRVVWGPRFIIDT